MQTHNTPHFFFKQSSFLESLKGGSYNVPRMASTSDLSPDHELKHEQDSATYYKVTS